MADSLQTFQSSLGQTKAIWQQLSKVHHLCDLWETCVLHWMFSSPLFHMPNFAHHVLFRKLWKPVIRTWMASWTLKSLCITWGTMKRSYGWSLKVWTKRMMVRVELALKFCCIWIILCQNLRIPLRAVEIIKNKFWISPFLSLSPFFSLSIFVFLGRIDSQEIMQSLRDLGVHISEQQAEKILKRSVHQLYTGLETCIKWLKTLLTK